MHLNKMEVHLKDPFLSAKRSDKAYEGFIHSIDTHDLFTIHHLIGAWLDQIHDADAKKQLLVNSTCEKMFYMWRTYHLDNSMVLTPINSISIVSSITIERIPLYFYKLQHWPLPPAKVGFVLADKLQVFGSFEAELFDMKVPWIQLSWHIWWNVYIWLRLLFLMAADSWTSSAMYGKTCKLWTGARKWKVTPTSAIYDSSLLYHYFLIRKICFLFFS
jgi:hypothetical protein